MIPPLLFGRKRGGNENERDDSRREPPVPDKPDTEDTALGSVESGELEDRTDPMMDGNSADPPDRDGWTVLLETTAGRIEKKADETGETARWVAGSLDEDHLSLLKERIIYLDASALACEEYTEVDGKFAVILDAPLVKLADFLADYQLRPAEAIQMIVDLLIALRELADAGLAPVTIERSSLFTSPMTFGVAGTHATWRVKFAALHDLVSADSIDDSRLGKFAVEIGAELLDHDWDAPWQDAAAKHWRSFLKSPEIAEGEIGIDALLSKIISAIPDPVAYLKTDVGKVREGNEDSGEIVVETVTRPGASSVQAWVADGMGGHAAGEVASMLAITAIRRTLADWRESAAVGEEVITRHIARAFERANAAIKRDAELNPSRLRMGTTLTGAIILSPSPPPEPGAKRPVPFEIARAWIANLGDSRTYLAGSGRLYRLSHDHSLLQQIVDCGRMTEEEAFSQPGKNVISKCLGGGLTDDVAPDVCGMLTGSGDLFLVASDGLTDLVPDSEILGVILDNWREGASSLEKIAGALIDAANAAGGKDNITVALVYLP